MRSYTLSLVFVHTSLLCSHTAWNVVLRLLSSLLVVNKLYLTPQSHSAIHLSQVCVCVCVRARVCARVCARACVCVCVSLSLSHTHIHTHTLSLSRSLSLALSLSLSLSLAHCPSFPDRFIPFLSFLYCVVQSCFPLSDLKARLSFPSLKNRDCLVLEASAYKG